MVSNSLELVIVEETLDGEFIRMDADMLTCILSAHPVIRADGIKAWDLNENRMQPGLTFTESRKKPLAPIRSYLLNVACALLCVS